MRAKKPPIGADVTPVVRARIVVALADLRQHFYEGVRLSFIARLPGDTESEMIVTDDDFDELVAVTKRICRKSKVPA